jgi:hypothetical protein
MSAFLNLRRRLFGRPLDPLDTKTRRHIALAAFFAWVGLGADGISSSCYGPEEAFRALGEHTQMGLYLALATAATVFIIALAYNQVIELFPTGGGGYRVATRLIGPYAGLTSGAALVVDYVLTISISIASGVDAFFSLLPLDWQPYKLATEVVLIVVLVMLNLRGIKEVIAVLLPIFLGFVLTHAFLIVYGVLSQATVLPTLVPEVGRLTSDLTGQLGWTGVAALLLLAYSQGGGTYTGLEAVSNNVNVLAEPRVHTGKVTMLGVALSLAFTARHHPASCVGRQLEDGQTLNAVTSGDHRELRLGDWGRARRPGRRARARSWAALRRGEHGLPRRPRRARQHGSRLLGASPVPLPLDAPGHRKRHSRHGGCVAGDSPVDRRQRRDARGALQRQRVLDLRGVALRPVPVLGEKPRRQQLAG